MDKTQIILGVLKEIVYPALTFLIGALIAKIKVEKKKKKTQEDIQTLEFNAMKEALKALMRSMLRDDYSYYTEKGYCSIEDREEITILYECYKGLKGNGKGTDYYQSIMNLPKLQKDVQ